MSLATKLKSIIKKPADKATFGTNPMDPWSAKAGINEDGSLNTYLKAKGINPEFVSTQTKISHAKSQAFLRWKQQHVHEDIKTTPSIASKKKNLAQQAVAAHKEVKAIPGPGFGEGKISQTPQLTPEATEPKQSALEKFRAAAAERAKKHAEIQKSQSKDGSGMSSAIDRLEKHLNKEETIDELKKSTLGSYIKKAARDAGQHRADAEEDDEIFSPQATKKAEKREKGIDRAVNKLSKEETEQIDELKKSTVKSWLSQQPVVPARKPGMDKKAHNKRIKSRSKSWDSAIDRLTGAKPTSEEIEQVDEVIAPNPAMEPLFNPKELTPDEQRKADRDVKLLGKYADKGLSIGGALKRFDKFKAKHQNEDQGIEEVATDYSKRRQRERDIDAGKPVARQPKNPQTDYAKKRAKWKKEMELGEEETRLDPKCWKGKKIGNPKTKMKGGVRVNNCVPATEDIYMEDEPSPVESAIIGYVDHRLGIDRTGAQTAQFIGPGVMALNGVNPMSGTLNMGSNKITNLVVPTNKKDRFLMIYGWGSESADQANKKEIDKIINSISLTK